MGAEGEQNKMIETAVFFDHVAYNRFSAIYDDDEIMDHILAYVNQVAAIYRMPSLGHQIDIMITYLEIQTNTITGHKLQLKNNIPDVVTVLIHYCLFRNNRNMA